jgi:hypothetical protein
MEVLLVQLVVALVMVALDIGLMSLDEHLCINLELCSWMSIAANIINSESSSESLSDDDSMTFL